jgi:C-terminal processing protease CtpA/Prc
MRHLPALLLGLATLTGCGGSGDGATTAPPLANACSETNKKQFVLDTARDRYLFLDLLPAAVDLNQFATAADLVNGLTATARAQNKDRFFSFITTISGEQSVLAEGRSIGFGINTTVRQGNTRVFISQVIEGSAAADAGIVRGDEILAIGTTDTTLEDVGVILGRNGLTDAFGPSTAGVSRAFRMRTPAGATVVRTVTKREFAINPVPAALVQTIPRVGNTPVGYFLFRTFISPADAELRNIFQNFRNQGVRDIIMDLRFNGGGLVITSELLMNLVSAANPNQTMYRTRLNSRYTANQQTVRFATPALSQAVAPLRIAFLTSGGSASASELVINSVAPYLQVAIVGSTTLGKPVGQTAHDISNCDFRLRLVTFGDENRDGYGDYFSGLPPGDNNYTDVYCPITDDVSKPLGAVNENLLAEALGWINDNRCGTVPPSGVQKALDSGARGDNDEIIPIPDNPAPLQVYMPGSF